MGRGGFEIRHTFQSRNVDQDAAGEDAILYVVDRVFRVSFLEHRFRIRRIAVIEDSVRMDVGQRIEVRMGNPVVIDRDSVLPDRQHGVLIRIPIVNSLNSINVPCEGDREALLYESRRLPSLGRRNQVQGSDLVVLAPSFPVRKLHLPAFVFRLCDSAAGGGASRSGKTACPLPALQPAIQAEKFSSSLLPVNSPISQLLPQTIFLPQKLVVCWNQRIVPTTNPTRR